MSEKVYEFYECYIPERMMGGIKRYVEHGIQPGSFLTAVIQNDLTAACFNADDENRRNIPAYVAYFYNKCPKGCWGSTEKMKAWMEEKRKEASNE